MFHRKKEFGHYWSSIYCSTPHLTIIGVNSNINKIKWNKIIKNKNKKMKDIGLPFPSCVF